MNETTRPAEPTPGPWGWFGNARSNEVYLSTVRHGRRFVMQFGRWGMRGAQPIFRDRGVMRPAADFLKFEVGDPSVTGVTRAMSDSSVYRMDICGIDHPDARLLAESWSLYSACKRLLAADSLDEGFASALEDIEATINRVDAISESL